MSGEHRGRQYGIGHGGHHRGGHRVYGPSATGRRRRGCRGIAGGAAAFVTTVGLVLGLAGCPGQSGIKNPPPTVIVHQP